MFACVLLFFFFHACFFLVFFLSHSLSHSASCTDGFLYSYKQFRLVCQLDNVFYFVSICSNINKSVYQTSEPSKDCGTFFEGEDCKKGRD